MSTELIRQILRTIDDSVDLEHNPRGETAPEGSVLWMWHHDAPFRHSMQAFAQLVGHMAKGVFDGAVKEREARQLAELAFRRNEYRLPLAIFREPMTDAEQEFIERLPGAIEVVMDTTPLLPSIQEAMRRHPAGGGEG